MKNEERNTLKASIDYGIGANGSRLKNLRPEFRAFVVEVLKASCVYADMLSPDELMFTRINRSNYAIHGDDMNVKPDDMLKLLDIAQKLNLEIKI